MGEFSVFIEKLKIQERVVELGTQISKDFAQSKEAVLVAPILKGAFVFAADLIRQIQVPVELDFLELSSYDGTKSTGKVKMVKDFKNSITGRNILIVEDIIDTGITLDALLKELHKRSPASVRIACLLSKPSRREVSVEVDYIGFEIEDRFVIGYGLDFNQRYREFSDIRIYKETEK